MNLSSYSYRTQAGAGGDDLKITHHKSRILQMDDYYPFGLTFNSYQRPSGKKNDWKFQGQEHDDLTGWDMFKWRNHQPDIGRFFNVDPLAEDYYYNSPYAFSENKVVAHVELEGLESHYAADGNIIAVGPLNKKSRLSAQIQYANKKNLGVPFKNDLGHKRNYSAWVSQGIMERPVVACWRCTNLIMQYANVDGGYRGENNTNVIQTAIESDGKLEITVNAFIGLNYLQEQVSDGILTTIGVNHTLGKSLNEGTTDHFVVVDGIGYDTELGQVFLTFNEVNNTNEQNAKSEENRLYVNQDGSVSGTNYQGTTYTVSQVRKNNGKIREDEK